MRTGYFGPAGTYTHQAAAQLFPGSELAPYATIQGLLEAADNGLLDVCVAPMENSTEGIVNATVDSLIFERGLFIKERVSMPIVNYLLAKYGDEGPFGKVFSHPQALAQCDAFLRREYPETELVPWTSSAQAAQFVAAGERGWAAVGTRMAAELYGLAIVGEGIQDESGNETAFVVLSQRNTSALFPGAKTTIAFAVRHKPGELYRVLDIFALWNINMTSIVSRPFKGRKGEYVFMVDLDVGEDMKDMADALTMVQRKTGFYKTLGCYRSIGWSAALSIT